MKGFELNKKATTKVEREELNLEQDNYDLQMINEPGKIIFATERTKCKSTMLIEMVN
jgi:hypothetical protein